MAATLQIFGVKGSQTTRAAERFFKERGIAFHLVDLDKKPMSPGEIRRFTDKFGLAALIDTEGKPYIDGGMKYLKQSDAGLLAKIEQEPKLLRLPLIRAGNLISIGKDEETWKQMADLLKASRPAS
jgi:arsenate reductase-like glutaredoxin family protein